jgi:2-keto-3-deoxy-L-rhamnonate aldolase RhmA
LYQLSLFSSKGSFVDLANTIGVDCVKAGKTEAVWNDTYTMAGAANTLGAVVAKKIEAQTMAGKTWTIFVAKKELVRSLE